MTDPTNPAPLPTIEALARIVAFEGLVSDGDMLIPSEKLRASLVNLRAALARALPVVEAREEFTHDPALCIKPACSANCCDCNEAISGQQTRDYAIRYAWLRSQPLDAVRAGGIFIGKTPDNFVLNEEDADAAIDSAMAPKGETHE